MQGLGRLGDATSDYCAANPSACGGDSTSGGTTSGGGKKSAGDIISSILNWGKSASEIYDNTKSNGGSTTVINTPGGAAAAGMSMGTKVAIGAAGAVVIGGLAYAFWPKKKK